MTRYRDRLPQLSGGLFLTDGGLETTFVFVEGIDLPCFASFVLLDTPEGREGLRRYYESYLSIARDRRLGFVLDTATWRASRDWGAQIGYDPQALARINREAVAFLEPLRRQWDSSSTPVVINGVLGPRGDGYQAGDMGIAEARDYHLEQAGILAGSPVDMLSAITMNSAEEAAGIALAARDLDLPCVVSFTVETDGRLVGGKSLREAVETVDAATDGHPAYYMINCAHPEHFRDALARGERWLDRVRGIRANASAKSHEELDNSTELDIGDMHALAADYRDIVRSFPQMNVLGGCCGTDHRHVAAICEAVMPQAATA